ncbi:MAG TPA: flagellar basal body rod protein FlgC [Nitrospirota bacterium]|jgi:flagellar basal-body rod protein FlgC
MDFFGSMDISASGLEAQRIRMNVIAGNLANAGATRTEKGGPYRRKDVVFESSSTEFSKALETASGKQQGSVKVVDIVEDNTPFRKVYDPGHPDADKEGYVSMPNVSVPNEMVNLISATRSYQANITAVNAAKSMAAKALEIGR